MGNMHLVTGYMGQEHITAIDQAAFNAALIGTGQFVLDKGNGLEAQVITNNQIRILDGELMMQGRFVRLEPDTYVNLTIDSGAQGKKRNDLIVARYTKNMVSGVESVDLVVIKGTAVDSNPVDPAFTESDITNGEGGLHDFPLWRIPIDGLNVGSPVALFGEPFVDSMQTLPDIRRQVNEIRSEANMKASTITYEATVTTTWNASGKYFYQDITVNGILATDNPIVDIKAGSDNDANVLYGEAICSVIHITTSANSIRVWAKKAISTAFPIQLKVVR